MNEYTITESMTAGIKKPVMMVVIMIYWCLLYDEILLKKML
jgi:hypothetical protein